MSHRSAVPLLLGMVLGGALLASAQVPINLGQTVSGSLSASSGRSVVCSRCYANQYQFTVPSGSPQVVFTTMTSSAFDTYLRVLDSSGTVLFENDDDERSTTSTDSFIGALLNPGTYRIEATSYNTGVTGAYTLGVQGTAANIQTTSLGQTLSGNLSTSSGRTVFGDGSSAVLYEFTVSSQQVVVLTMRSAVLNAYLILMDSSGLYLASDDDSGGGTNGTDAQIVRALPPGRYRLEASTYVNQSGAYTLSLQVSTPTVTNITVGQTVNGMLSATSGRSASCGACYADLYQFTLTSPQTLSVAMNSAAFDTYLRILDANGTVLSEDDDSGGGTDSFLQRVFAAGTYRIEATSYNSGSGGAYTLALRAVNIQVLPISVGQPVSGTLTSFSGRSVGCSGCFADVYQFSVTSSQTLTILLTSSAFDAYLRVLDSAGNTIATDDDSGGGSNARINRTFAAGAYRIEATSYSSGETGAYTLALTAVNTTVTPITVGAAPATVSGTLSATTSGTSVGCSGCLANWYGFTLGIAQTLEINLTSTAFDTYLRVLDANGVVVAADDDSGAGSNSSIQRSFAAGSYRIEASSYNSGATGAFTLVVQVINVTVTQIAVGQTANGTLSSGSARSSGCAGCYAVLYQFTVSSAQQLIISLNSTAFDAYLRVLDAAGTAVATDDDSGGGSNARINRTFAAGIYRIEATSYGSAETGAYTLSVATASSGVTAPVLTSLSPSSAQAGGAALAGFTLLVNGSGFVVGSVVQWAGSDRSTTFVSSTQLQAAILASDLASASTVLVTARTGTAVSNSLSFTITSSAPTLTVTPEFLNFGALENQASPAPQNLTVAGNVGWTASVRTSAGGNWLTVTPASGTAPTTARVGVSSTGLAAGVYTALLTFQSTTGGLLRVVAATLTITKALPILQPSQTGFLFQGIEGQSIPAQTFQVLNVGSGAMNWQIRAQTPDGKTWLSVSPASGSTQAGSSATAPTATVRVDSTQLKAGISVGLLTFEAPGAPNSPQSGLVLVNMLPAGSDPVITVQPAGFVFVGTVGGAAPAGKDLIVSASGGPSLQFTASASTAGGRNWLTVTPASGSLEAGRSTLRVRADTASLARGTYTGTVTVTLGTGVRQDLSVVLIVSEPGGAAGQQVSLLDAQTMAGCTPTRLTLVETMLAGNFALSVSWPVSLRSVVVNDCGQVVTDATVVASFSTGDPPVVLTSLRDGNYIGNWIPGRAERTTVTIRAVAAGLAEAVTQIDGKVGTVGDTLPQLGRNATVNAASYERYVPLAPGTLVSLFGSNLGTSTASASTTPLPTSLADVRAQLGGKDMPLLFANSGQVNAQVPTDLAPGTTASIVVTVKGVAAAPDQITLAEARPGIFTLGTQQGAILVANSGGIIAAPAGSIPGRTARPADRGEYISVYCTGLGATDPQVPSGQPAGVSPLSLVKTAVTVNIGGIHVSPYSAELAPGFVGLYQVDVQVPAGVQPGSAVPLFITQGGVNSNTVTVAVR